MDDSLKTALEASRIDDRVCPAHGSYRAENIAPAPTSRLYRGPVWSSCPECEKSRELAWLRESAEQEQAAFAQSLERAGVPPRFAACSLESFVAETDKQRQVLASVRDYADQWDQVRQSGRCIVLCGSAGTGKTHLAVGIAKRVLAVRGSVCYTTVQAAVRRVQATWSKDAEHSTDSVMRDFTGCDLLILDEVGVQSGSQWEKNLIFDLMNERYNHHRPSVLISNLVQDEVGKFLGDRVVDRLREDGGRMVFCNWPSKRRAT